MSAEIDRPLGEEIPGGTWDSYRKDTATWAVKLPRDVTIPTREGEVEADAGDYLCIDADGGIYPCDGETFERMYSPIAAGESADTGSTEDG